MSDLFDYVSQRTTVCSTSKELFAIELAQWREQMQSHRCCSHSSLSIAGQSTEQRHVDISFTSCRSLGIVAQTDSLSLLSTATTTGIDGLWHTSRPDCSEEEFNDGRRIDQYDWNEQCHVRRRRWARKATASSSDHGLLRMWILFETISSRSESHPTPSQPYRWTTVYVSTVHKILQYLFESSSECRHHSRFFIPIVHRSIFRDTFEVFITRNDRTDVFNAANTLDNRPISTVRLVCPCIRCVDVWSSRAHEETSELRISSGWLRTMFYAWQ